jgi:PAS domain S-box-containing protein
LDASISVTNNSALGPVRRRIQLLYVGDASLAWECFGRRGASIEVTAAPPEADRPINPIRLDGEPYDILLIEHGDAGVNALATLEQLRARNLHVPAIVVADWDEELAAHALRLGASDYVTKNRASFRALYFRLHRLIAQAAAIKAGSTARTRDHELEELRRRLSEIEDARDGAERRLREALEAVQRARQGRLADAVAAAKEHAQRESEFTAKIAEANSVARALQQQVRDHHAILRLIEERTARAEHIAATAARRQGDIESALREESAKRRNLETQLAHESEALREIECRRSAEAATYADQLSRQQAEFNGNIAEMTRGREVLEQRLQEAVVAANQARDDRGADAVAAAQRETILLADLRWATDARERLDRRLVDADAALRCAEQRVIAAHQEGQQRLNERQGQFHAELSQQHATIDALREEIAALKHALQESEEQRVSDAASAAVRLNSLQAQYDAYIVATDASRDALQRRLDEFERALAEGRTRHESEMADAARQLADTRERADARLAESAAALQRLEQQLHESESERQRDHEGYACLLADAAAQFGDAQDAAEQQLAEAAAASAVLESRLRDSEVAREHAREQHASEIARSMASLEEQQRRTETWLTDAAAVANTLEGRLVETTAQLERVREDAARERETALASAAAQQVDFEIRLAEEIATQGVLNDQLQHVRSALEAASNRHESEIAAATARLAESEERAAARWAQADTAIKVAESKRAEAIAALNRVVQQATAERQAAAAEAAERHAHFNAELTREVTRRDAIERELIETRTAAEWARREFTETLAAAEARALDERTKLEERSANEHAEWERLGRAAAERISELTEQLDTARQSLARAEEHIARLTLEHDDAQAQAEHRQRAADRDLAHLRRERDTLQQSLDHTRATADEILTRVTQDRSIERARLEAIVADLETQLKEQTERTHVTEQAASVRLAETQHRLGEMRAANERAHESIAQLENQLTTLRRDLDAAKNRGDVLRATAERVPILEKEMDDVRAETRRQFEENPTSWFRCRRSGEIIHANRAMRSLLGYEPLELQQLDFGDAVFDSANDFQWILDRCLSSLSTQSMETPWRRKDGRRIIVRVVAVPATADSVDLVAENITHVRELEEKLRNAQRMESVARYGSEVAVTCQGLLTQVKEEGEQWLAGIESDTVRYRGELLLGEVTRASAYLGQLAAYSEEQQNIPDLVDVNKVLRDLEPVLKRVAGANIDVVLPKASAPLNLDVEPRPIERMLVNVAAYGRERMPFGGRLRIDVDSVVVDREFVAKYPHVRPGEHVLLIVNEERRVIHPNAANAAVTGSPVASSFSGDSPGVDLGTLQALVSECGGHLWMRAEPPGDMELKIHLPRRILDRLEAPATPIPSGRSRWIRRAFGSRH